MEFDTRNLKNIGEKLAVTVIVVSFNVARTNRENKKTNTKQKFVKNSFTNENKQSRHVHV